VVNPKVDALQVADCSITIWKKKSEKELAKLRILHSIHTEKQAEDKYDFSSQFDNQNPSIRFKHEIQKKKRDLKEREFASNNPA
jgi:hypothetical protein